jgi:hypothetical protein
MLAFGLALNFYANIRDILDHGQDQKDLVRHFVAKAMNEPLFFQPVEKEEFYKFFLDGIKGCKLSWQGIHQGSIKEIGDVLYLEELRRGSDLTIKQRISHP